MKLLRLLLLLVLCSVPAHAQSIFDYRIWGVNSSMAIKAPVKAATTGAITLSGAQTIDGVSVTDHLNDSTGLPPDRVLVKNQTDQTTNGIYNVSSSGAWTRSADFDGPNDVASGTIITIVQGTQAGFYQLTSPDPITIASSTPGGSNITFQAFTINIGSFGLTNGDIFVGNSLNVATGVAPSGDCTLTNTGAFTCTKSNGVANLTTASTIPLASIGTISNNDLLANVSGITQHPSDTTLTALIDGALGSTRGSILERGASGWQIVAPGSTTGKCWMNNGLGTDPTYQTCPGAGTGGSVTSVGLTGDNVIYNTTVTNSPITVSGSLVPVLKTQSANTFLAGPTSSTAQPTFRAIVGGDLPVPSATTLGGVESLAAASHNFLTSISTSGVPAKAQPACGDLSDSGTGCAATLATIATSGSASDLSAGTVPTARLGSGSASSSTYLRGDQSWATLPSSGALVLLATVNASNVANISFNSAYITNAYNCYKILLDTLLPVSSSADVFELQVGTGSTPETSGYQYANFGGNAGGAALTGPTTVSAPYIKIETNPSGSSLSNVSHQVGKSEINFCNPTGADITTFDVRSRYFDSSGDFVAFDGGGTYATAGAINYIRMQFDAGNIASVNAHLYGIQGS